MSGKYGKWWQTYQVLSTGKGDPNTIIIRGPPAQTIIGYLLQTRSGLLHWQPWCGTQLVFKFQIIMHLPSSSTNTSDCAVALFMILLISRISMKKVEEFVCNYMSNHDFSVLANLAWYETCLHSGAILITWTINVCPMTYLNIIWGSDSGKNSVDFRHTTMYSRSPVIKPVK